MTLVSTLQAGVNTDQVGDLIRFAMERPFVTGVSFQPATYSGRYFLPDDLENRVTFPDVVRAIADQAGEYFADRDFLPLPCAHPNGHVLAYAFRSEGEAMPLNRFVDLERNMDLLANGIVFTRERARSLVNEYVSRSCGTGCDSTLDLSIPSLKKEDANDQQSLPQVQRMAGKFLELAMGGKIQQADLLRVTITSFMDAYNFDVRQLMKSCVHFVLPSGHIIPFSAYNVLYRDGHVPLPPLTDVRNLPAASTAPRSGSLSTKP